MVYLEYLSIETNAFDSVYLAHNRVYQGHLYSLTVSKRVNETVRQHLIPALDPRSQHLAVLERLGDSHGLGLERLREARGAPPLGEAAAAEPQGECVQDEAQRVSDVERPRERVRVALPPAREPALDDDVEDDADGEVAQQVEDGGRGDHPGHAEQRREEDVAEDAAGVLACDVVLDDGACESDQEEPVGPGWFACQLSSLGSYGMHSGEFVLTVHRSSAKHSCRTDNTWLPD